ncbi:MAG TPA: nuclear transport factor 2 family protein [Steroidobacteraceae bacterium]|nr:nuclear transport factor 2 family protein [Steroidobacteraceae bacterium]
MVSHSPAVTRPHPLSAMALATLTLALALALALATLTLTGCASTPRAASTAGASTGTVASAGPALQGTTAAPGASPAEAQAQVALQQATTLVIATERAFAATMAQRNFKGFLAFLSPDAVFFSGSTVEHGPVQIAEQWAPYFQGRRAPFAWQPDDVQVLPDGKLALSTGPVLQDGRIVGRFNSVWRLEGSGIWHIVFDKGEAVCSAPPPTTNGNGNGG